MRPTGITAAGGTRSQGIASRRDSAHTWAWLAVGVASLLSSGLIFLIQPMIAKYLLPWFGGSPATWSACVLFFQVVIVAGYAYAFVLVHCVSCRGQRLVHLALLLSALLLLKSRSALWMGGILPADAWRPSPDAPPVGWLLALLGLSVGLPAVLLAATSPLLQAWLVHRDEGARWGQLYAISNLGAIGALLAYPICLERVMPLSLQASSWSVLFVVYFGVVALVAVLTLSRSNDDEGLARRVDRQTISAVTVALWFLLSGCGAAVLLAATNEICQAVAAVPLLWVVPLSLYLLSMVLCFARGSFYNRAVFVNLLGVSLALSCLMLFRGVESSIVVRAATYSSLVFFASMVCHGELARLQPHGSRLTAYYLSMAVGSAAAGVLINLVAPFVFSGYWELHATLWLTGCIALYLVLTRKDERRGILRLQSALLAVVFGLGLIGHAQITLADAVKTSRSFHGVLRVVRDSSAGSGDVRLILKHGGIVHGVQYRDAAKRTMGTSYFGIDSGVGLAMLHHPRRRDGGSLRVGVVGLGVGTVAALGQPGDLLRFYELDPDVARLAAGKDALFSYLKDSPARCEVVIGDGRLVLERELAVSGSRDYDLLVLDAFSSDTIPMHLLTKEAFATYLAHLRAPSGMLVMHVTNRHLDLAPIIQAIASDYGLSAGLVESPGDGALQDPSSWVLVPLDPSVLNSPGLSGVVAQVDDPGLAAWTDDFSNIFDALKERR